ncbi:hypothetical protein ACFPK5_00710 [Streptomyces beijiangensis]|uniref:hypothetical protein n=1 Tax=Streptomyces beijiangensis TaxID=163361 RepID=UPI0031D118C1
MDWFSTHRRLFWIAVLAGGLFFVVVSTLEWLHIGSGVWADHPVFSASLQWLAGALVGVPLALLAGDQIAEHFTLQRRQKDLQKRADGVVADFRNVLYGPFTIDDPTVFAAALAKIRRQHFVMAEAVQGGRSKDLAETARAEWEQHWEALRKNGGQARADMVIYARALQTSWDQILATRLLVVDASMTWFGGETTPRVEDALAHVGTGPLAVGKFSDVDWEYAFLGHDHFVHRSGQRSYSAKNSQTLLATQFKKSYKCLTGIEELSRLLEGLGKPDAG